MSTKDTQTMPTLGVIKTDQIWSIFPDGFFHRDQDYNDLFFQETTKHYRIEPGTTVYYSQDGFERAKTLFMEIMTASIVPPVVRNGKQKIGGLSEFPFILVKMSLDNIVSAARSNMSFQVYYQFLIEQLDIVLDCSSVMSLFSTFVGANQNNEMYDNLAILIMCTKAIFDARLELYGTYPTIHD